MKKFSFILAAAVVFAVGSAFTNAKDAKAIAPKFANTYYVTAKSGTGSSATYTLSTASQSNCQGGNDPCQISTNLTLGTTAPQSVVNDANQVQIITRRNL